MKTKDKAQAARGRKGGLVTKSIHGLGHYSKIGKKGVKARRQLREKNK